MYYLNKWKINTIKNFKDIKTSYKENLKNTIESSIDQRSKNTDGTKISQNEGYLSKLNKNEKSELLLNSEEKVKIQ
jgi:hypothetical protein